ncbi:nucleoside diphosphate kinase regulator [Zoogloea sp.]|jgi:regulator of nucleoside diphosphate kinase|uniref:nucleoside diphosphate kinase regulator n=1 Tax=Zoogloea sp. TaxID=49181 RepID=UPI0035B2ECC5
MKPEITVSTSDLERLEGLLSKPPTRNRSDLDGLRAELDRANVLDGDAMPDNIIMMNSRARFREETSGREYELTLAWPHEANAADGKVSIFSPAGSALLGLSVGQSIDWQTPEGHAIQLRILAVSHGA